MQTRSIAGRGGKMLGNVIGLVILGLGLVGSAQGRNVERLATLQLSIHTGNPITVAEKGREGQFYFEVANPRGLLMLYG